jgi:hypothetical protein
MRLTPCRKLTRYILSYLERACCALGRPPHHPVAAGPPRHGSAFVDVTDPFTDIFGLVMKPSKAVYGQQVGAGCRHRPDNFFDDSFVGSVAEMSHLTESYLMRAVEAGSGPNNPL